MKNFASLRELLLAPRKKVSLSQLALLLCAGGGILVSLGHDAGAGPTPTPGAPSYPNLNFTNTSSRGFLPSQPSSGPPLLNLYNMLSQSNGSSSALANSPVTAPFTPPAQSFDPSHAWGMAAPFVPKLKAFSYAPSKHLDLNHAINLPGLVDMPSLQLAQGASQTNPDGSWTGQGALPNSIRDPWHYTATNFDPTFRTPYWNEYQGFTNNSFELALADTDYGRTIYDRGLNDYVGKSDLSSIAPHWGGDGSEGTRALLPNSPAARASAAL